MVGLLRLLAVVSVTLPVGDNIGRYRQPSPGEMYSQSTLICSAFKHALQ